MSYKLDKTNELLADTLTMLWADSADNKLIIFSLFFLEKETICMKCQILFSRKNKKKCFKMSSAEIFTQYAKYFKMSSAEIFSQHAKG